MDPLSQQAPMQKAVLKSLLGGHDTGPRIAEDTGLSITQTRSAIHQLTKHGFIQRVKRGTYKPNVPLICLVLRDKLTRLEKRRRRAKQERGG